MSIGIRRNINRLFRLKGEEISYIITDTGREMLQREYDRLLVMVNDGNLYFEKFK